MIFGPLVVLLLIVLIIWYGLERREKARIAKGLERHSNLRLIFASFAILTVLFSGVCGIFLAVWIGNGIAGNGLAGVEIISLLPLPPLLIGAFVWWLAMRRRAG